MRRLFPIIILLVITGAVAFSYFTFISPNINAEKRVSIKIPTGSSYIDVLEILNKNHVLKSEFTFSLVSKMKHYPDQVKSGYYVFTNNMNNRQIVNMLRTGLQTPVELVIYNIRTKEEFSKLVGRTLELDSNLLSKQLNDQHFCAQLNTDSNNILSRFIVDNYEFYWNIPEEKFLAKMGDAYAAFWNKERKSKAVKLNLSEEEVTTLASIVEKEVIRDKELPTVAGVYLNRLKIGMPLQADPTLVFALKDFNAQRVTEYHKDYDSPYNTYKYAGLPPGPICMPRKKSIDAVLNFEKHDLIYFCANPDMSGYSIFTRTYEEQMKTAYQYRKKLDEMNIK